MSPASRSFICINCLSACSASENRNIQFLRLIPAEEHVYRQYGNVAEHRDITDNRKQLIRIGNRDQTVDDGMVIHKVLFAVFVLNSVMPSFFIETMKLSCGTEDTDEIEQIKAQTEVRLLSGKEPKPQLPSWSRLKMYRRSQEIHDSRSETASAKHTDLSYFESSFPDCVKIFFISAEDVCTAG